MKLIKSLTALFLIAFNFQAFAAWQLDLAQSQINFLSTKKEHVVEIHKFDRFDASISDDGTVNLQIDLTSVNTLIPIRNERMQKFLFETDKFAQASFSAKVNLAQFTQLKPGQSKKATVNGELDLHGIKLPLRANLQVVATENSGFLVSSSENLVLDTRSFELLAGVDKLRELAGLPSISYSVPVTFNLAFNEKAK